MCVHSPYGTAACVLTRLLELVAHRHVGVPAAGSIDQRAVPDLFGQRLVAQRDRAVPVLGDRRTGVDGEARVQCRARLVGGKPALTGIHAVVVIGVLAGQHFDADLRIDREPGGRLERADPACVHHHAFRLAEIVHEQFRHRANGRVLEGAKTEEPRVLALAHVRVLQAVAFHGVLDDALQADIVAVERDQRGSLDHRVRALADIRNGGWSLVKQAKTEGVARRPAGSPGSRSACRWR